MEIRDKKQLIQDALAVTFKLFAFIELRTHTPRKYGTADLLFMTEVDTLDLIGRNENMHASDIAQRYNISRTAVAKTLERLRRKGLIQRDPDPVDSRKIILTLTPKGKVVYDNHKNIDDTANQYTISTLSGFTEEELQSYVKVARVFEKVAYEMIGFNGGAK